MKRNAKTFIHPTHGAHIVAQKINKTIAYKISQLGGEGMTEPLQIKRALSHYANTVIHADNPPNTDDHAYNIQQNMICKIISTRPK